jgi:hypothetical protein
MDLSNITVQNLLHLGQLIAIVVGAIWGFKKWNTAQTQRKEEFEWRRAELAWRLTDKIHEAPDVLPALQLLDHETDKIAIGAKTVTVTDADIANALEVTERGEFPDHSDKGRAIRAAFDALLYSFERVEHAKCLNLITRQEIFAPTKYYARLMAKNRLYEKYANHIGYAHAWALISSL